MFDRDHLAAHVVLEALLGGVEEARVAPNAVNHDVAHLVQQVEVEAIFLLRHAQHEITVRRADGEQRVLIPKYVLFLEFRKTPTVAVTSIFLMISPDSHE